MIAQLELLFDQGVRSRFELILLLGSLSRTVAVLTRQSELTPDEWARIRQAWSLRA